MIEENAVVLSVDGDYVLLETRRKSTCSTCNAKHGCGSGLLSESIGTKSSRFKLVNSHELMPGDRVKIGLHESALLKGSFIVYMVPLLLLIAFAIIGQLISQQLLNFSNELIVIIFAMAGLWVGLSILKRFNEKIRYSEQYQPVILDKLS